MIRHKDGPEDPIFPGINTLGWLAILDIRTGVFIPTLVIAVLGAIYGGIVYLIWCRWFNLEASWTPTFFGDQANFVDFLETFYLAGSISSINSDIDTLRSIQGDNENFFLKLKTYVSKKDPDFYIIRDLVIAASWAQFGGILPHLREEAVDRISILIPKGTLSDSDTAILAKVGRGGDPLGYTAATTILVMVAQRFEKAVQRTGEKRGLGDTAVQMQISETHTNLMKLRGELGTIDARIDDSYGLHIAYIQMLGLAILCDLLIQPWGRVQEFGYWVILLCAFQFFLHGGMFVLGTEMHNPYTGYVRINVRKVMAEIEESWAPYQTSPTIMNTTKHESRADSDMNSLEDVPSKLGIHKSTSTASTNSTGRRSTSTASTVRTSVISLNK